MSLRTSGGKPPPLSGFQHEMASGMMFALKKMADNLTQHHKEAPVDMMTNFMLGGAAHRKLLEAALKHGNRVRRAPARAEVEEPEETLVEDHREALRPAQHVERKLASMLQESPVLISQFQKDARPRGR